MQSTLNRIASFGMPQRQDPVSSTIRIAQELKAMEEAEKAHIKRAGVMGAGKAHLRQAMQVGKPGVYSSSHREEARKFKGWHYVAIQALMKQGYMCEVKASERFDDDEDKLGPKTKSVYNKEDDKGEPLPRNHRLMELLRRPNPKQSGGAFIAERILQLSLTGVSYVWNVPNKAGLVIERYVLPTAIVEPQWRNSEFEFGCYRIRPEGGRHGGTVDMSAFGFGHSSLYATTEYIDARDVQVVLHPHPILRDDGQSPVNASGTWTDLACKIDESNWSHMELGPDPSLSVEMDGFEGDQEDLDRQKEKFYAEFGGSHNHGKVFFAAAQGEHAKTRIKTLTTSPKDMQYAEGFERMRDAILAIYGVNPLAAGIQAPSGREGLYAPLEHFACLTVQPLLSMLADDDNESFAWQFRTKDRDDSVVTIEYEAKKIKDEERDGAKQDRLVAGMSITKGELRTQNGMELFGDDRDEHFAGTDPEAEQRQMEMQQQQMAAQQSAFGGGNPEGSGSGGFPEPPQFNASGDNPEDSGSGGSEENPESKPALLKPSKPSNFPKSPAHEGKPSKTKFPKPPKAKHDPAGLTPRSHIKRRDNLQDFNREFWSQEEYPVLYYKAKKLYLEPVNNSTPVDMQKIKSMGVRFYVTNLTRNHLPIDRSIADPVLKSSTCGAGSKDAIGFQHGNTCSKDLDRRELDGKGIERKDMPQISSSDMPDFEEWLADRNIETSTGTIPAEDAKPVQSAVSNEKVADMIYAHELGTFDVTEKPITMSSDGFIMDGHHRWAAADEMGFDINVRKVDATADELLELMDEYPRSFKESLNDNRGLDKFSVFDDDEAFPPAEEKGVDTQDRFKDAKGNYTKERQALHNQISAKHFANAEPVDKPVFVIMGGGPASGKSTLIREGYFDDSNMVTVNSDDIKHDLPEYQRGMEQASKVIASYVHEESSELSKKIMTEARDGNYNTILDGTGDGSIESLKKKVDKMRKAGMPVIAQYVTVDTEEAVRRNKSRYEKTGRYVPDIVVKKTHAAVSRTFEDALESGLFDEITLWDTNGDETIKVLEGKGKDYKILDQKAWDRFLDKGKE